MNPGLSARVSRAIARLVLMLCASSCGDRPSGDEGTSNASSSTTGGAATTVEATTAVPTTGASTGAATTGDPTSTTTGGPASTGDGCEFACMPDVGQETCDSWLQDCREGEKCAPVASDPRSLWDTTLCVPLVRDPLPPGALCEVEGWVASGRDNCAEGSICLFADFETHVGECVSLCGGTHDMPICPQDQTCFVVGDVLNVCVDLCDPLVQDCGPGRACVWTNTSGPHLPACVGLPIGDAGPLDACNPVGMDCAAGSACRPASTVSAQCAGDFCCTPYCDVDLPPDCPDPAQTCISVFAPNPPWPGYEHLGFCGQP